MQSPTHEDTALETLISAAYTLMLEAEQPESARTYFDLMRELIARRSPQQVLRMEIERRIAP